MEDYKQRYEKALEQAEKELETCGSQDCDAARQIFRLFPELQKSEDERIRNNIIKNLRFIRDTHHRYSNECNEAINWLKNNPIFGMPKIKFKVGDWVIFKNDKLGSIYQVEKLENYAYILRHILGGSMPLTFYSQHLLIPWTIENANNGDILQSNNCTLIFDSLTKDIDGNTVISSWYFCDSKKFYGMGISKSDLWSIEGVVPATKEQRDLLFKKIHEAGYKWDADSKRLNWINHEI